MQLQEERAHTRAAEVLPDGVLIEQACAGNQRAFETLVRRYHGQLSRYVARFLSDENQTDDVLQRLWLQLYFALPTLSGEMPLKAWLFQVARFRCLDVLRQKRRRHAISFSELEEVVDEGEVAPCISLLASEPQPEEIAERHETRSAVLQAIQALPPNYRAVVLLRYFGQLPFRDIVRLLQIPMATAKTYCYRARQRLRIIYQHTER